VERTKSGILIAIPRLNSFDVGFKKPVEVRLH